MAGSTTRTTSTKKESSTVATSTPSTPVRRPRRAAVKVVEEQHPLAHLIPKQWFADQYVSRTFAGGHTDQSLLGYARDAKLNTLMFGPTGPGKTSSVMAFAATNKLPVVYVACNGAVDPATLFTRPQIVRSTVAEVMATAKEICIEFGQVWEKASLADRKMFFEMASSFAGEKIISVESDVVTALRTGGIIYLDEVNMLPPRNAAVFHGALDLRRTVTIPELGNESITLHPKCQFVCTLNMGQEYHGVKELNAAFFNRFAIKLEFNYSRKIEETLVVGLPVLLDIADKLRDAYTAGNIETPVGPNMLIEFEQVSVDLGVDFAVYNFLNSFKAHDRSVVDKQMEHYRSMLDTQFAEMQNPSDAAMDADEPLEY